jgi:hypothetical protein
MNNIYNIISDIDIPNGTTRRMNCPECGGLNTFTVTNNLGSLVWNCYKASCGTKGGKRVHLSVDDIRNVFGGADRMADDIEFRMPEYVVPIKDRKKALDFLHQWDLISMREEVLYDAKEDRIVFPVLYDGKIVDGTGRSLSNRLPKWKKYGKSGLPFTYGYGNVAVVVEDCVSASVVGSLGNFVGVALMGTSLLSTHRVFLTQFSTAVIALDPDALPKTINMAKELRGHVNDVRILRLTDDIKYRNPEDITNLTNIGV